MRGDINKEMFDYIPEIDFNIGYRYFLGNAANYSTALLATLKSIKSKLPLLISMYNSEEFEGLRIIAQTLQKMLSNIGASQLAEASYQLEEVLFTDEVAAIQDQLAQYVANLMELSDHLETLFKSRNDKGSIITEESNASMFHYDFTRTKDCIRSSADLLERKII